MDMFADPMAELLARIEALEAAVFAKAPKPAKEAVEPLLGIAWAKWDRHRSGKRGWTADARTLSMRTLRKLAGTDGTLALAIVDQSIERGWTGLFPLKAQDGPQASQNPVQHKTVKQALTPTEDKLTAQVNWLKQSAPLRGVTQEQLAAEIEEATRRLA